MKKNLSKYDYIFVVGMLLVFIMHLLCVFGTDHATLGDESFYPSISLRLINGESLVQHEWELTQFSSLFLYLPVCFWVAIKGSAEGIILFQDFFI